MCVFLGSMCLKLLLRDDFESLKCCLDLWLSCMLDCIHIYVFPFLKNYFYTILTPPWHLAVCWALKLFLIAILTPSWQLCGSMEKVLGSLIASRQLVDRSNFFYRVWWILPQHLLTATSVNIFFFLTDVWHLSIPLSVEREIEKNEKEIALNLYIEGQ